MEVIKYKIEEKLRYNRLLKLLVWKQQDREKEVIWKISRYQVPLVGSELANIILDLEKFRTKKLGGDVPAHIFFQLKNIFHILETLGSARIEGNNTTLS